MENSIWLPSEPLYKCVPLQAHFSKGGAREVIPPLDKLCPHGDHQQNCLFAIECIDKWQVNTEAIDTHRHLA